MKKIAVSLFLTGVLLNGCATSDIQNVVGQGSAVSISQTKLAASNPHKVKVYYGNANLPKQYKVIGHVSAERYNLVGLEHTEITMRDELKKQAASIGANGVINITSSMTQTSGDAIISK